MARRDELTDEQWAIIEPLLPPPLIREDGKGRPRVHDDRSVMNGILWVLRTGTCWMDLPDRFPSGSTCYRRFSHWVKTGSLRQVLEALAQHLEESKNINLSECFIDGTFVVTKKGGQVLGKTKRGKGTKLMVVADAAGLPLSVYTASASPHEVTLVEATLAEMFTVGQPRRIIGDRAYDSDPLDEKLSQMGIELIAPHRLGRIKPPTQDGRCLRRYKRRWKVERLIAWLTAFKKVHTRWEYNINHYNGFVYLACIMILFRRYL
ncbi:MAG TPA: IS5 family transposase [Flavisolibacter sp.]|nr:IS5 family transposase [Flavisolibacter sp.]